MTNLWDDDQNEEFRDIPDETKLDSSGQLLQAPPVQVQSPQRSRASSPVNAVTTTEAAYAVGLRPGSNQEINLEELGIEEEEDFTEVLNDANLRIEQGRLYQMIMNHDLFEGMDSDPRAVQNVQKEIRKFARERMEIMLGMRQEQKQLDQVSIVLPFNDLEIDILKKIASKATNGATETPEANEVAAAVKETPKRQTINPIGNSSAKKNLTPKTQTKLLTKNNAPIKRTRADATVEQILAEEGVSRELIEEDYQPIGKPLHKLSAEELAQRQKETSQRLAARKTVKSASALPMAGPEQQEILAVQRAQQIGQAPGMSALLEKVKSMPVKNP